MNISERITQQQFKELLEDIYIKGREGDYIQTKDILKDIQNKLITLLELPNKPNY